MNNEVLCSVSVNSQHFMHIPAFNRHSKIQSMFAVHWTFSIQWTFGKQQILSAPNHSAFTNLLTFTVHSAWYPMLTYPMLLDNQYPQWTLEWTCQWWKMNSEWMPDFPEFTVENGMNWCWRPVLIPSPMNPQWTLIILRVLENSTFGKRKKREGTHLWSKERLEMLPWATYGQG